MEDQYCMECGRPLRSKDVVMLDMNVLTHQFRKEPWPESDSQGSFPFGRTCAKKVLRNGGYMIWAAGWP
jgi:hypothetical protein